MPGEPTTTEAPPFAHPSEEQIARLLTYYGVRWEYEPRSFPLEWNEDGQPNRFFTPDFYLPDHDLYLEVTTVKPSLTNRKNRKIRRLRELYPEVTVKLLAYKDVQALFLRSAGSSGPPVEEDEEDDSALVGVPAQGGD